MAANMGALAESYGVRQGIKYRGQIKDALEAKLDGLLEGLYVAGKIKDREASDWHNRPGRKVGTRKQLPPEGDLVGGKWRWVG